MTEEIIINGVNVAGCEFFNDCECKLYKQEYWELTDTTFDFCKEHPLCEYKTTAILERLEQENKDLKKQIESDKGLITVGGKQQYDMTIAYDKCKTALEEIREIVNEPCIEDEDCETCDSNCMCKEILDKINEVLNS